MLKVLSNILYIEYVCLYHDFGLDCFWTYNFGHDFKFFLFCLYITPVITVSASFGGYSIDLLCELIDWSVNYLDALIKVYSSYLIYALFIFFIYLFVLCYICICLLIILIFINIIYISIISIYISISIYLYVYIYTSIYIYIYMCVCVCVFSIVFSFSS